MSAAVIEPDVEDVFTIELPLRPYPGLRPFEKHEWPIFFGRERMADEVIERLVQQRFLVVHGDSGCGKSSLIRAGVLPRLEQEAARGGMRWLTCITTPGDEPIRNFTAALSSLRRREADPLPVDFRRAINCGSSGAATLASLLESEHDHICILFDQFEEVFAHARRHGAQEARLLVDLLVGIQALASPRLCVILTMRSEFLGACAQFKGFAEAVNATQYLLPRMTHCDLVRAIREPASLYDGEVSIDLAERLIHEAAGGQDQLSLVQHGLMLLHRNCTSQRHGNGEGEPWQLSCDSYRGEGGLIGLLSNHADEVMETAIRLAERPEHVRQVVEDLFRALTEINAAGQATRCPQKFERLVAVTGSDESTLRAIIEHFRADGVSFLRPYGTQPIAANDYVDISHEALIRCWHRIADEHEGWLIREFKNGLMWRSLLVQAESFEASAANVLSAATTEERSLWLQRRNAAWSERYGGGWPRVQQLMAASVAKLESERQEEAAERQRAEEARVREQRLQSELVLAQERGRRERLFRVGFTVVLVLSMVTVVLAVSAYRQTNATRKESERLVQALEGAQLRGQVAEQNGKAAQATIEKLVKSKADLVQAVQQTAPSTSAANLQRLTEASASLDNQVEMLREVTQVPPTIFIHFAEEAQRAAAKDLQLRISTTKFGDSFINTPGVELRDFYAGRKSFDKASQPRAAVLRCFRPQECQRDAPALLELVNAQLAVPAVTLQDVSRRYANSSRVRERQFELWFGPGEIVLQAQMGKGAKY